MATEITLITGDELRENWSNVDQNLSEVKLKPYIIKAQQTELQDLLGPPLYYDLISNITDANYILLLNGGEYVHQTYTIYFSGLKPYISALSYKNLIADININVGRASVTEKDTENSTPHANPIVQTRSREGYSEALRLQAEVIKFLDQKRSDYPLWNSRNDSSQDNETSGFGMTRVPRHQQR
jgi:hypothetical protein